MELNLESFVILITTVLTGLTAGLCFTWTNAITPGIGLLDDLGFLQAFQAMNRAIINPTFVLVFFGPAIGHLIAVYLKRQSLDLTFWLFLAAAVLFIFGVVFITLFKNVQLNEILDKTDLAAATLEELKALREKFENPWNRWHLIRTISSLLSLVLLLFGILFNNQTS